MEQQKELLMPHHLLLPLCAINRLQNIEGSARKGQTLPVDVLKVWRPSDRRLLTQRPPTNPIDDPLENTHVLAISRPQKLPIRPLPEPVHMKHPRRSRQVPLHLQPMPEVVAHVVPAERQHSHRITPYLANRRSRSRRSLRAHRCPNIDPRRPIERLINKRHCRRPPPTKDEGRNGHTVGILPVRIHRGTLASRRSKATVGVSRRSRARWRPLISPPINQLPRRRIGHTLPPDAALGRKSNISEDGVLGQRRHRIWISLRAGARSHAKKTSLRIDGAKLAFGIRLDPGNVVSNGPDLPALEAVGRNHHREIGLAAGRGESSGNISLFTSTVRVFRRLDADDQHMLGHPAFIASNVGGNAKRKALLTKKRIAAVA